MNAYDSERMTEILSPLQYVPTDSPMGADLVILNTCHIREKAAEKLYSDLGRLRKTQAQQPNKMVIAVGGCVAQAEGDEVMRRADNVSFVFGPQTYHKLPRLLEQVGAVKRLELVDTEFTANEKFDDIGTDRTATAVTGFVTVQEGCDKFCSFCVVPYTRGAEFSRPAESIIAEVKSLTANGMRDIMLLGQNVNAYQAEKYNLARLIKELANLPDLQRIRFMTSHPKDMDDELIKAHGEVDKLMPYLHLPIQSGSNKILKAMNRRHTAEDYLRIIDKLRHARPDIALTSDFIVGYPEETDADFTDTIRLVNQVGYANAYSFKYSPRPGTPAADKQLIPEEVGDERLQTLQQLLKSQQAGFDHSQKGKTLPVLFEKQGRKPGQIVGRSPYLQPVHLTGDESLIGKIIDCHITDVQRFSLFAEATELKQSA